jgi:septum formation protein
MRKILLASSSPFRKELFSRLKLPFTCYAPEIDETPLPDESWQALALRLSVAKAKAASEVYPDHVCIGSDEVAAVGTTFLGKPGNEENAKKQLRLMSDQKIAFHTGVCVFAPFLGHEQNVLVTTSVKFRPLTDQMIQNYLTKEEPYNSAGSFKSETLGSALIEYFEGSDPTALIGLPLIALCDMLAKVGIEVI